MNMSVQLIGTCRSVVHLWPLIGDLYTDIVDGCGCSETMFDVVPRVSQQSSLLYRVFKNNVHYYSSVPTSECMNESL
jgi:hypothetical protein